MFKFSHPSPTCTLTSPAWPRQSSSNSYIRLLCASCQVLDSRSCSTCSFKSCTLIDGLPMQAAKQRVLLPKHNALCSVQADQLALLPSYFAGWLCVVCDCTCVSASTECQGQDGEMPEPKETMSLRVDQSEMASYAILTGRLDPTEEVLKNVISAASPRMCSSWGSIYVIAALLDCPATPGKFANALKGVDVDSAIRGSFESVSDATAFDVLDLTDDGKGCPSRSTRAGSSMSDC